jgi:hypothetical protein
MEKKCHAVFKPEKHVTLLRVRGGVLRNARAGGFAVLDGEMAVRGRL